MLKNQDSQVSLPVPLPPKPELKKSSEGEATLFF